MKHTGDLWEPSFPVGASGPTATTYTEALTGVPYHLIRKSAIENPELLALVEGEDLITIDTARFPPGTPLASNWIIVDRTLTIDGEEGLNYGQGWIVRGDPVKRDNIDTLRDVGMVEAYVSRLSKLPTGVG
jgi:hypothetical protein